MNNKYVIGIGCKRNSTYVNIATAIDNVLIKHNLSLDKVVGLSSCDLKNDEVELLNFAKKNNLALMFFTKDELKKIATPNPSETVLKKIGIPAVCEAAALLAVQKIGDENNNNLKLIVEKTIYNGVTIAVAQIKHHIK